MMKKTFATLLLLLTVSMSLSAQSLTGTWRTYIDDKDNPNGAFMYLTFGSGGSANWKMTMRMEDVEVGQMDFSFHINATYTLTGNSLVITFDTHSVKMQIDRISWSAELAKEFYREPEMESLVKQVIMGEIEKQKENFGKTFPSEWNCTVIDLTDNTLMFNDGSQTTTWVRFRQ